MSKILHRLTPLLVALSTLAALAIPAVAQESGVPPLSQPGPHDVGFRLMTFADANRQARNIEAVIWYPAVRPENADAPNRRYMGWSKAAPDIKGAPYPLILYSHGYLGSNLEILPVIQPLVTHGFVVVGLQHPMDSTPISVVDRPLDILFVLNHLATTPQPDFKGVIDMDRVGVLGWSKGAYTSLALNGARIDPVSAANWTAKPMIPGDLSDIRTLQPGWNWNDVAAYRAKLSPLETNELWPPFADKRIQAVMPIAACLIQLFGEKGLAAATVPTFIVAGTADPYCPYEREATFAYAHLGSKDRYLLTLVDAEHEFPIDLRPETEHTLAHFATAFFGYYLQGKQDYAQYLTAKYVDSLEAQVKLRLVWGPYQQ
ncbi:MAG: hypothetical protein IT324_28015 [Anaerolineae bacterium]|nr:hypothetical protein [Anaerolineae bacterium]